MIHAFASADYFKLISVPDEAVLRDSRTGDEQSFAAWAKSYEVAAETVLGSLVPNPGRTLAIEMYRAGLLGTVVVPKSAIKGYKPFGRRHPQKVACRRRR